MRYIFAALLLILAISVSCSTRKETQSDPEAQRKAQEWLDGIIANCDGKYFVGVPSFNIEELKDVYGGKLLIQLKEPELKIKDTPISDKDRYEGEEWSGFFSIKSKGWRYYNEKPLDENTWSDWRSSEPWHRDPLVGRESSIQVLGIKKNGKWTLWPEMFTKPQCSEIPPLPNAGFDTSGRRVE